MNEMTEAGGKAKGGRGKGGRGKGGKAEDATVEGQIGRMLVRVIWAQEWSTANPEAKADERKAAWKDARNDAMDKNLKAYRRALTALARSGVVMSMAPDAVKADGSDDDTGEDA